MSLKCVQKVFSYSFLQILGSFNKVNRGKLPSAKWVIVPIGRIWYTSISTTTIIPLTEIILNGICLHLGCSLIAQSSKINIQSQIVIPEKIPNNNNNKKLEVGPPNIFTLLSSEFKNYAPYCKCKQNIPTERGLI